MADQPQIIRVDPARTDDIRSYAMGDAGLALLFRRVIFAPDNEQSGNQLVPSAAVALPWALVAGLRRILDEEISKHEALRGPIAASEIHVSPRMN